ncbi:unnamed protein product [Linum tenue]|uniref:Cytochrome P450 n=1 Tax=Linum tenue TaxID=586396 RepID=A0AAV0RDI3_9ROSI|nr:unnamed protein product [Linum tenue]
MVTMLVTVAWLLLPPLLLAAISYRRRPTTSRRRRLPPGSSGFPIIGETLHLFLPSTDFDLIPFLKSRLRRYGPVFTTNLFGKQIAVSADSELNHFLLHRDQPLIETWHTDTSAGLFGDVDINLASVHKYVRFATLRSFGVQELRERRLPEMERRVHVALRDWSERGSVEVKYATATMVLNYGAKLVFGYDPQHYSKKKLVDLYSSITKSLISIPLKIPGTTHYKCLKEKEKAVKLIRKEFRKRQASFFSTKERSKGDDLLDHAIRELNDGEKPYSLSLTEDFIVNFIFALNFVSHDTIANIMTLAVKLIEDHPLVLEELVAEHEAILKARESSSVGISWDEYKSMTFTLQVINETLRLGNLGPGILRRAVQDIHTNRYTIPEGCGILIAISAMHLNPDTYKDPLTFNPWRWSRVSPSDRMYKDLMPFGWGMKQCAGSEYARLFVATFLHVLVTKYTWKRIKGGNLRRNPLLIFDQGLHVKFNEKEITQQPPSN